MKNFTGANNKIGGQAGIFTPSNNKAFASENVKALLLKVISLCT
jgi:hypothetical protein